MSVQPELVERELLYRSANSTHLSEPTCTTVATMSTVLSTLDYYFSYFKNHLLDLMYHRFVKFTERPRFTLWECQRIDALEPLLKEDELASPLALPYSDTKLGAKVDLLRDLHWRHEEINMNTDLSHFVALKNDDIKYVLRKILWFFAFGDNLVVENLVQRFGQEIKRDVVVTFYSFQIANEEEHKLTYARLINTIIDSEEKRRLILNDSEPALRSLAAWISKWILDRRMPFAFRLLAFVFVEGVFFTSCFSFIYWLRTQNLFPGLGKSNEFIARDENLHALFACELYKDHVVFKLNRRDVLTLTMDAIDICDQFINAMFMNGKIELSGMNANLMKKYVRNVTNYYLSEIGLAEPIFPDAYNPFPFMVQQSLEGKTNFFESDVSEYQKAVNLQAEQFSDTCAF